MRKRLTPARLIAPKAVERRDRSTCPERRGSDWSSGGCRGDATEVAGARFEGSSSRVRKPVNPRQKCGRLILRDWPFDFARYTSSASPISRGEAGGDSIITPASGIAAYGFLILERSAFPPSARWRREKPALSGRSRPSRAADPSRAPRAQLDRHGAQAADHRLGEVPLSMPMLPSRLAKTALHTNFSSNFVTQ